MSTARAGQLPLMRRRALRIILWTLPILGIATVALFLFGRGWIESYLRSDRFRQFVSQRTSETLRAEGAFAPFKVGGTSFYSDEFIARGGPEAWFSEMRIDQLRADVSARRFFEKVWQIDRVSAQRIDIKLDGTRVVIPPRPVTSPGPSAEKGPAKTWLPNRVEIAHAQIREMNLSWGEHPRPSGSVRGTTLTIAPREGGWDIAGGGGTLAHGNLPALEVSALRLRYREPTLFVQSAEFRQGATGVANVNGEVRFKYACDLAAQFKGISITPLLAEDWRVRLHGNLAGDVTIRSPLPARGPPVVAGALALEQGVLEALPVLDQIALFTRTQQFRRLVLSKVTGDFRQEGDYIEVRNFAGESEGLLRIEGNFTVKAGMIDGRFEVGVTPASLQWLPGSQERVFVQPRGGYVWTPLRLTGPLAKPQEDLSPRLIAAAQRAVIEGVENRVRDTIQTGKDAAKGALDLLMPLFK